MLLCEVNAVTGAHYYEVWRAVFINKFDLDSFHLASATRIFFPLLSLIIG